MCIAVPAKVISIEDQVAAVEVNGVVYNASLVLLPDVCLGDYVLVHAGCAIQKIDQAEAAETLALFEELAHYADKA